MVNTLTVGSLFSGIGGIDLGLERAGMTVKWHSEIDPYACRVLKKHWPEVPNLGDITTVNWKEIPYVDVIAGGYPCQPFSLAGRRNGEHDPRHLWPYFRDAISVLRPRYALLENVRGHLTLGGLSVIGDLAAIGYDCEWRIISAASVGANHRRDRLIVVTYPNGNNEPDVAINEKRMVAHPEGGESGKSTEREGWQSSERGSIDCGRSEDTRSNVVMADADESGSRRFRSLPDGRETVFGRSDLLRGEDGFTGWEWWQTEPDVGRVAHGVPFKVDRLRGLGNAVVPQVAEVVGRLIMEHANG